MREDVADRRDNEQSKAPRSYRWTCPICQTSNIGFATERLAGDEAINALKSHLRAHDGSGHGVATEFPDGLDAETLAEYVETEIESEYR